MAKQKLEYLEPGRLEDVLTLIQILGYHPQPRRSIRQICTILVDDDENRQIPDDRIAHWQKVAKSHRELFRVAGEHCDSISLIARHVAGENEAARQLSRESVHRLMDTAIELHDKQVRRDQQWAIYLPLWVAGIALIGSIATALLK